ncbi:MAG: ABC transporter permease subunit [Caldilinea sp.]|nr:ABC transporter permease subunit [Caldilinea sp.]MDW8441391.1 ABC transporter permease subunit [Caldilineaceae bacterium]
MRTDLFRDSLVIFVKEWREWSAARTLWPASVAPIMAWGAVAPHLLGQLERGPLMVGVLLAGLPLVLSAILSADSLAGERERRTLETLLASRLSEQAILLGKMSAAVVLGWMLLLSAATPVILQQWLGPIAGFERLNIATLLWGLLAVGAPCVVLAVTTGALIALYTSSARVALFLTIVFGGMLVLIAFGALFWQPGGSGELLVGSLTLTGLVVLALDITLTILLLISARRERMIMTGG